MQTIAGQRKYEIVIYSNRLQKVLTFKRSEKKRAVNSVEYWLSTPFRIVRIANLDLGLECSPKQFLFQCLFLL